MKKPLTVLFLILVSFVHCVTVYPHCQIPCGIYDDQMRVKMIREHLETVQKSMKMIEKISGAEEKNFNQLVRWIDNKDEHADKISEIVTYYFMAQRIHLPDKSNAEQVKAYNDRLSSLHEILYYSMKMKQTTDSEYVKKATESLETFEKLYFGSE